MVLATIRMLVPPDSRRELVQTLESLLYPIRRQTGCLSSHLYVEVGEENGLCFITEWESQADWDQYLQSREFAVLIGVIDLLKGSSEIEFELLSPIAGIDAVIAARRKGRSLDTDLGY